MRQIEQMLQCRIGLDAVSIGSSLIQRTVRLRMKSLGLSELREYEGLLANSRDEWIELVESVLVTETWFFRDSEPFSAFIRLVFEDWLPANRAGLLRVLSLPCSSGEEPYSLVMALLDAGIPPERFQVDAIDISHRILAKAQRGLYGRNSFRGKELKFRDHYFQPVKEGFILNPAIRNLVRFSQGNLLDDDFHTGKPSYDFIFCRNLLIYFDRTTQQRALQRLGQLLTPTGMLFVGAAEQPLALEHGFVSANIQMAFACRKVNHAPNSTSHRPAPARPARRSALPPLPQSKASPPRQPLPVATALAPPPPKSSLSGGEDLEKARRLADAGRLAEAASICEAHLRQFRTSAHAYYLLGLVRDAAGDPAAVDCYRKALYLEPGHYEALLQMALLAEKDGDSARARTFKSRAQRSRMKT